MFLGEFSHTMDDKGRTTIPMKFRKELGEAFVIAKGLGRCLSVYDAKGWKAFTDSIDNAKTTNTRAKLKLRRSLFSSAADCSLDKQGRVVIPPVLREYAGLNKELVIVGVHERAEIWDKNTWEEYISETDVDLLELADSLEEVDIY